MQVLFLPDFVAMQFSYVVSIDLTVCVLNDENLSLYLLLFSFVSVDRKNKNSHAIVYSQKTKDSIVACNHQFALP